ncbi:MAG: hypothetical protein QOK27_798 [Gemmatimonadales bacterium]|jgi:hypothetical protein|nr:hypothetical protein [Gemmatimonadales bacterium]
MPKKAEPGRIFAPRGRRRARLAAVLVVLVAACQERDRLTFPDPGDGIGPVTMIDQPNGSDTTVDAGPDFFVNGRTVDPDGVDTVYFLVTGGNQNFNPFRPSPPADTVRWGLPISTTGRSGSTITVQVHGVDLQGNQGAQSVRQVIVR